MTGGAGEGAARRWWVSNGLAKIVDDRPRGFRDGRGAVRILKRAVALERHKRGFRWSYWGRGGATAIRSNAQNAIFLTNVCPITTRGWLRGERGVANRDGGGKNPNLVTVW